MFRVVSRTLAHVVYFSSLTFRQMHSERGSHAHERLHAGMGRNGSSQPYSSLPLLLWLYGLWTLSVSSKAGSQYNVTVPRSVRVRHSSDHGRGVLYMDYPMWEAAKKDGTRDLWTNNARIIKNRSTVLIDWWKFSGKDPFVFYDFVLDMRRPGAPIGYCREEQVKGVAVMRSVQARQQATSIDGIISQFKDSPTDFEPFCADMFRHLGWSARVTPPSHDGGFDLRLRNPSGVTYIAECQCYNRRHHVGRPVVQKLQGGGEHGGTSARHDCVLSNFCGPFRRFF